MPDGDPGDGRDLDALRAAHQAEQGRLNEIIVVTEAESVARAPRREDLVALQRAARRGVSAARGRLTKAQKDGHADKIADARARLDTASAEFDRVSDAVITEMHGHVQAHLDNLGQLNDQISRIWAAGDAVTDAIAGRRPPRPGRPDGTR